MALSNAEKQRRWRERHIAKRRNAHRIVNLLVLKRLTDEHIEEVAGLLNQFLNREGVRTLRRALKGRTDEEMTALYSQSENEWRDEWLREHPGRTRAEYKRLVQDDRSEVWEWRRAKGRGYIAAEQRAWERDHPGEEYPEHECGLTDREYTDLGRWRRQRKAQRDAG